VSDWQDVILVNMLGKRFYDETGSGFSANGYKSISPYTESSYLNAKDIKYKPDNFINAAWPASAMDTTAAVRSGQSSIPMRLCVRAGIPRLPMSISRKVSFQSRYPARARQRDQNAIPARPNAARQPDRRSDAI